MAEHYIRGRRYCRKCEKYFHTNALFCPECGKQLRSKPRHPSSKKRFKEKIKRNEKFRKYYDKIKNDLKYRQKERLRASIYYYLNREKILAKMAKRYERKEKILL